MTTTSTQTATNTRPGTLDLLSANAVRAELVAYLKELKAACGTLSREQVVTVLGQWYHPLHYFPTFLSRLISVTPEIERQTFISRILWQELGEGDPRRAHEKIYLETIAEGELEARRVAKAAPSAATDALVAGYRKASEQELTGLGFLYGTEVVDLPMVSTVGELMRRCTGKRQLAWVQIHVQQEPHHVESSEDALGSEWSEREQGEVLASAEELWRLWINFFKGIRREILPS
jgi:pyrroloquinoline quinone (PQQ) biosynthesis protein C